MPVIAAAMTATLESLSAEDAALAETVSSLDHDGYAIIDLGPSVLALCDAVAAAAEPLFRNGRYNRLQDAWRRLPAVRRLAAQPDVRGILTRAYGREAFPFQTLNFRAGSQQGAHTDTAHFHSDPPGYMCGVWWALEDVELEAGPLFYYPGSHKLPMPSSVNNDVAPLRAREAAHMAALGDNLRRGNFKQTPALLRKGQAFIWTANLAHGGMPIQRSGATRRSMVTHYYFKRCRYMTPIASSGGRMMARLPVDIASGRWVWPMEDSGRPAPVPIKKQVASLAQRLLRTVYRG